jgi:hypothetical protein
LCFPQFDISPPEFLDSFVLMVRCHPCYADARFRPLPRRAGSFLDIVFDADILRSLVAVIIETFDLDPLESDEIKRPMAEVFVLLSFAEFLQPAIARRPRSVTTGTFRPHRL